LDAIKQKFNIIHQLKSLRTQTGKVSAKALLNHITMINQELILKPDNQYKYMPEAREELYFLYKWLF